MGQECGKENGCAANDWRGREADRRSDIPTRGWKEVLIQVWNNIGSHRVFTIAAAVTFYAILALFPAIAAFVALYGLFADPATISSHLNSLAGILPGGAIDVIGGEISRVAAQGSKSLGLTFVIGLLTALWSANAGVKAIFDALNMVYNEHESRGIIKLNLASLVFTTGAIVFLLVAIAAIVVFPIALGYLGLSGAAQLIVSIARWPVLLIVVGLALAVLYRFGPDRAKPRWRWVSWGSAFATVLWLAASIAFSYYAAHFGNYNKTYGSLGAVIGFMVWIWISMIVLLVGAEINAELEHQTAKDTGTPKPIGRRRAQMADTVPVPQG
ncbi:MAG: rane protein [Bradyrhizobium sp.]|nr:rane protein [Bradyrhizobium sp.]